MVRFGERVVTSQDLFDETYICSLELCRVLGVTPATLVNGYRRGALPEPVRVNRRGGSTHVMLWPRLQVQPHVDKWLAGRRAA